MLVTLREGAGEDLQLGNAGTHHLLVLRLKHVEVELHLQTKGRNAEPTAQNSEHFTACRDKPVFGQESGNRGCVTSVINNN